MILAVRMVFQVVRHWMQTTWLMPTMRISAVSIFTEIVWPMGLVARIMVQPSTPPHQQQQQLYRQCLHHHPAQWLIKHFNINTSTITVRSRTITNQITMVAAILCFWWKILAHTFTTIMEVLAAVSAQLVQQSMQMVALDLSCKIIAPLRIQRVTIIQVTKNTHTDTVFTFVQFYNR